MAGASDLGRTHSVVLLTAKSFARRADFSGEEWDVTEESMTEKLGRERNTPAVASTSVRGLEHVAIFLSAIFLSAMTEHEWRTHIRGWGSRFKVGW